MESPPPGHETDSELRKPRPVPKAQVMHPSASAPPRLQERAGSLQPACLGRFSAGGAHAGKHLWGEGPAAPESTWLPPWLPVMSSLCSRGRSGLGDSGHAYLTKSEFLQPPERDQVEYVLKMT